MNPGFPPPPPPDDEAADPLLRALRQRLGDYGQAPPPGAWAAIRQRVSPPPLPPPWWRRRHLLAVFGLLLGCLLLPGKLGEWAGLHPAVGILSIDNQAFINCAASRVRLTATSGGQAAHHPASSPTIEVATPLDLANRNPVSAATATRAAAPLSQAAKTTDLSVVHPVIAGRPTPETQAVATANSAAYARSKSVHASVATPSHSSHQPSNGVRRLGFVGIVTASPPGRQPLGLAVALDESRRTRAQRRRRWPSARPAESGVLAGQPATVTPSTTTRSSRLLAGRSRRAQAAAPAALRQNTSPNAIFDVITQSSTGAKVARQRARSAKEGQRNSTGHNALADSLGAEIAAAAGEQAASQPILLYSLGPLDLLAPRLPNLLLSTGAPLATLVARPDSAPAARPVRRWALLMLAGPTLSYRTLGPAPVLAAGHPDFARLERPALGLGAQVQVRRLLSGRWALAVGVGYHEYATRLALALADSGNTSVHQRDTYRLLTVPVQLSYALGVPQGRLSKALLLGAEPGWYLGGRSTEGSGCGCEQQAYTIAASSPYRPLTVAFSLGLDLRYRLGGADSRWQWLVQPTGRYVATPFVRSEAVGFTQRQPFSLGLLTGFSWDVR